MEIFGNIPPGTIRIIKIESSDERKKLHQYLEKYYPNIHRTSLKSKHFCGERTMTFIKCYHCGNKRAPVNNYHYGTMDNNMDEWRSGECNKCGKNNSWEPNFEGWDDITLVFSNNMIALGDYFTGYNIPKHATPGDIERCDIENILKHTNIYNISSPKILMNKKDVTKYIDDKLSAIL